MYLLRQHAPADDESRPKCHDELTAHRTHSIAEASEPGEGKTCTHTRNDSSGKINRAASRGTDSDTGGADDGTATGSEESKAAGRGELHSYASSIATVCCALLECDGSTCGAHP